MKRSNKVDEGVEKSNSQTIIPIEIIENRIFLIRG